MENFKQFLKNNFIYLIIAFACLVYVSYGIIIIEKSGKSVLEIIGNGLIILIFGYLICRLFSIQGINAGKRNKDYVETKNLHSKIVGEIDLYINTLDDWCEKENEKVIKDIRKRMLSCNGINYGDCFDENGRSKDFTFALKNKNEAKNKDEKNQIILYNKRQTIKNKVLNKVLNLTITPLSIDSLITFNTKHEDPFDFGQDKNSYLKQQAFSDIISKSLIGIIFSYFTFSYMVSYASLIQSLIQVAIFLLMGAIKYMQSYYFIIDNERNHIIKQINYLQKFKSEKENQSKGEVYE
ncbi:MAG: hypothetical protein IJW82_06805 [Clostridia bacterium]|nr:hypothetical protein [Clostridia bacterium]